jgi:circadian clock protein KaiC
MFAMVVATMDHTKLATTGIAGLDDVLRGGLPRNRFYLLQGNPGVGKTTLGLQFLLEGLVRGESCLYVTLSESEEELRAVAATHGWSLDGLALHELATDTNEGPHGSVNTIFHPADVELKETITRVLELVERTRPQRVVFDSLSEMRLLAGESLHYRRQMLALKQHFAGRSTTVLFLDDGTASESDTQLRSIAHGVILLEAASPNYGAARRALQVVKLRGVDFRSGRHDYVIRRGGLVVFPRLVAAEHRDHNRHETVSTGLPELDALLGGGMGRGTSMLFLGPAGSGKSSVAGQLVHSALGRGERAAYFTFDETIETLLERCGSLGFDFRAAIESGQLLARQVDPAELSPGEFAHAVREAVEKHGVRTLVIDSVNGYLMAMPEERFLVIQMHELLSFLNQRGVATILVSAQHGVVGHSMISPVDLTYLADTVLLFRFFENRGRMLKAISVLKKRIGGHEDTIREFRVSAEGTRIGPPLAHFRGILTGVPGYTGGTDGLIDEREKA